ncbi:MAG: hypothetical protein HOB79_01290 [Rhodospirillaceae bacterium]|jgi:hypothetical protein|nr:hypothetical protein [Rhodospirillaceae bacterium]MBT7769781.1 hypothetical protein [Rhodospirillales bacterium]MBT4699682.1 hypothetical protein [Rhodospirillaceae bacterium]MBT5034437.1 hypothetical protein [Rhodospirillaceae bacterium]MBT6218403.1 hypothetical protein [Rhodospirillaceae bacterium]
MLEASTVTLWWVSLGLGVVVSLVVSLLLWLIHREAQSINAVVSQIWTTGQRVANNTVHIPTLYRTEETVAAILVRAGRIAEGAATIEAHANGCPGCPQCMKSH